VTTPARDPDGRDVPAVPPFSRFFDQHRETVHRFLRATLPPTEADDCFQEAFLSALRAYPTLRDARNLRAWILTIAHRKALDAHRARARRPVPVGSVPEQPAPADVEGMPELWGAVGRLPVSQRLAVAHRFVSDLPYSEIAQILGCSPAAARQRVAAAVRSLRQEYTP
jgi:RNA polymerase sigma factor (sigma-70 family)